MMKLNRRHRRGAVVSLTSLIDVIFLLLMFFMLSSSFAKYQRIDLAGAAPSQTAAQREALLIAVAPTGDLLIDGSLMSLAVLPAYLHALPKDPLPILAVKPQAGASVQQLVDVLEAIESVGLDATLVASGDAGAMSR
ncbi:hypothetical protein E1162_07700 [Rhodobacteraceae bacterium RKSG542]|uniref:ExbD/TolR family protein n=1 Tax=Pseudovibrio flavus TaxID=2529854 RepID=UPI0012BC17F4|nr:biopolymer transporter ExbD [Pseudovibrio flavus]MTI17123.1 hypothetical protein [Pseudovibrio flavus]